MITLYGMGSPNVTKTVIMLEELQLDYAMRRVNVFASEQYDPGFDKYNPNHKVPVLIDEDGPDGRPYALFESGEILIYLAEKTGRLLETSGEARFEVLKWLMIQMAGVGPMIGQLNHFLQASPAGDSYSLPRYKNETRRLYDVLDRRLGEVSFLGGADYSIADIATYPWVKAYERYGFAWADRPHLARWYQTVDARPAVVAANEKVAPWWQADRDARANALPVDMDRFFNRL